MQYQTQTKQKLKNAGSKKLQFMPYQNVATNKNVRLRSVTVRLVGYSGWFLEERRTATGCLTTSLVTQSCVTSISTLLAVLPIGGMVDHGGK